MAKKRKKKRSYTPPAPPRGQTTAVDEASAAAAAAATPAPKAPPARRMHKEEARRARERALKQLRRRAIIRRVTTAVVAVAVIVGVFFLLTRVGTPELSEEAVAAMEDAGCSSLEQVSANPQGGHDPPYTYEDRPATSGPHDPSPLPAGVYEEPQPEERVVHSLEHAYAVMYYRADGEGALDEDVRTALEDLARDQDKVIVAPYAELPEDTALAFLAWNHRSTCPSGITAEQAETIANAWIDEFRGSNIAPEPNAP